MKEMKEIAKKLDVQDVQNNAEPDSIKSRLVEINNIQEFVKSLLKQGEDYGTIKYTKNGKEMETKPFLYKSGAEKIAYALGLRILVDIVDKVADENEIAYTLKCKLMKGDIVISEGFGVSSTSEYKFFKQINDNVKAGMPKDVAMRSVSNTILKMAEKRAIVDASLHIFALSGFFSQDEDYVKEELRHENETPKHTETPKKQEKNNVDEPMQDDIEKQIRNTIAEQLAILLDQQLIDQKFVDYLSSKDLISKVKLMQWKIKEIVKNNPNLTEDQITMLSDMRADLGYISGEKK